MNDKKIIRIRQSANDESAPLLPQPTDWRTKLAETHGQFRINGTYDHVATGRRLRRIIERRERKAKR